MKYIGSPADCKSPKTPITDILTKAGILKDQFTFETPHTNVKELVGMNNSEHSSSLYLEINGNSGSLPNGGIPNGHGIRQSNEYHNQNRQRFGRSIRETTVNSTTDHQCVSKCTLYILKLMTVLSLLMSCCAIVIMTRLWSECNELKNRLSTMEVTSTAGLVDTHVCLPCDDLIQGPFDEDNEQLQTLLQRLDNGTMTCCAKTYAQMSTMLDLFVKRKQAEKCNLELINDTVSSGCNVNTTTSPGGPPTNNNFRPSAHLQITPNVKQNKSKEDVDSPIRHWTDQGKVTHLDGIKLIDDRLRIPETGTYFLYSQVGFLVFYDMDTPDINLASQALFHKVYRYNPIYPNKGSQELLRSEVTQCWEQNKRYGRYTSYVGASVKLNRGDLIYVKVSRISSLSQEGSLTYFGLFKVNGS